MALKARHFGICHRGTDASVVEAPGIVIGARYLQTQKAETRRTGGRCLADELGQLRFELRDSLDHLAAYAPRIESIWAVGSIQIGEALPRPLELGLQHTMTGGMA
jgi:hypothetical protein